MDLITLISASWVLFTLILVQPWYERAINDSINWRMRKFRNLLMVVVKTSKRAPYLLDATWIQCLFDS